MSEGKQYPITIWQFDALDLLDHADRRDKAKGGDGSRTTVDVAERLQITTVQARKLLTGMADANLVDCFEDRPALSWKITDAGRAALSAASTEGGQ